MNCWDSIGAKFKIMDMIVFVTNVVITKNYS